MSSSIQKKKKLTLIVVNVNLDGITSQIINGREFVNLERIVTLSGDTKNLSPFLKLFIEVVLISSVLELRLDWIFLLELLWYLFSLKENCKWHDRWISILSHVYSSYYQKWHIFFFSNISYDQVLFSLIYIKKYCYDYLKGTPKKNIMK